MFLRLLLALFKFVAICWIATSLHASTPQWSFLAYYARMADETLNRVARFNISWADANLDVYEFNRELDEHHPVTKFFAPLTSQVSTGFNLVLQDDPVGSLVGFNGFLLFRWPIFPNSPRVIASVALLEGVSYISGHQAREIRDSQKEMNDRRFLNFLGAEIAVARKSDPSWQLVYRLHHRSGVFGLYSPGIVGSTAVGLGIRHTFE